MQKEYLTVLKPAVAEIIEKKSRFIAAIKHIESEEDAIGFINEIKAEHWSASHHVYAYLIGGNMNIQRYSDDGEPSGTAGVPVLEVIKRNSLQDVVVVVTRYFGGTLLGAAGLIRAYGKSAAEGIQLAGIMKKQLCFLITIIMEYTLFGKIQNYLMTHGFTVKEILYNQDVEARILVKVDEAQEFVKAVVELSNGRAVVEIGEKEFISLDQEGNLIL